MRPILKTLLILLSATLSSCATLVNNAEKQITLTATDTVNVVINEMQFQNNITSTKINVKRSDKPLHIIVYDDSLKKVFNVEPHLSFTYWLNAYPGLWPGFWIDRNSPKRFTYPKRIYVDLHDETKDYVTYDPRSRKGQWRIHLSVPYVNNFLFKPDGTGTTKVNSGFFGLTSGMNYYHDENRFLSLSYTFAMNHELPVPFHIDVDYGEVQYSVTRYIGITNNHRVRGFILGYGLSLTANYWRKWFVSYPDPPPYEPIEKKNTSIGLTFPVSYKFNERFFTGLVYRPTFFRLSSDKTFAYEHFMSLRFGWKIALN